MYYFVIGITIVVSIILVLIVLVQNSKGGGLASNFSSSNQVMGVRKTTDFLEKATWTMGIALVVLSIGSSAFTGGASVATDEQGGAQSKMMEQIDEKAMPSAPVTNGIPLPESGTPAAAGQPEAEKKGE